MEGRIYLHTSGIYTRSHVEMKAGICRFRGSHAASGHNRTSGAHRRIRASRDVFASATCYAFVAKWLEERLPKPVDALTLWNLDD